MVQCWREIARAVTTSGDELVLRERAGTVEIRCNGWELMSSRAHFSEERMAAMMCERLNAAAPRVLIGGLGMGYTLRATLDDLPATAEVVVAELLPEIVAWNRGMLGPLAGHPLDDSRVTVVCGDVADLLRDDSFDAIVLDVDNGPDAVMLRGNALLYGAEGLHRLRRALRRRKVSVPPPLVGLGREADQGQGEGRPQPLDLGSKHPSPYPLPHGEGGTSATPTSATPTSATPISATPTSAAPTSATPTSATSPAATPAPANPGLLAVWSADPSPDFEHRLADAGFRWTRTDVPARGAPDDPLHTIYLAHP
jgi:hypothetical protein